MHGKQVWIVVCIGVLLLGLILLIGCAKTKKVLYKVDYGGRDVFIDAKDAYAAGERVDLRTYIVMDATPTVTVDGERLSPRVDGYEYLVYSFTMPAHDVKVEFSLGGSDMMALKYRIEYDNEAGLVNPIHEAFPGEPVTLQMHIVFDKITNVYANGAPVQQTDGPDSDCLYYTFIMPSEDVYIEIKTDNIGGADPILCADYYERVSGIDPQAGEPGYYELALYQDGQDTLLLEVINEGGTPRETVTRYRVPKDVHNKVCEFFYTNKMEEWNNLEDTYPIDGMMYAVQYVEDGYTYRVTSESMPEGGESVFSAFRALLYAYLTDANRE